MTPFYQSPCGAIAVYCTKWEDAFAAGVVPADVALIHADPPYGVAERTDRAAKGRGCLAPCNDFPAVEGDDKPYDPGPLLALDRPTIMWGANHYASRLPDSPSWITWDKRGDIPSNDNADCELAWSNLGGPARKFTHVWNGMIKASEQTSRRIHGTQKPVALCSFSFTRAKLKRGDLVLVPYGGSMPEIPAALAMGLRVIVCEILEEHCRAAVGARLHVAAGRSDALPRSADPRQRTLW